MSTVRQTINEAITARRTVRIVYRDYHGNVTERNISPIAWVKSDLVNAFCHLRQEERHFRIDNILDCESAGAASSGPPPSIHKHDVRFDHSVPAPEIRPALKKATPSSGPMRTDSLKAQPLPPFTRVNNAEQWSRLLCYYARCLVLENLQRYVIKNEASSRFPFFSSPGEVRRFLAGGMQYSFDSHRTSRPTSIADFVARPKQRYRQQLCMGFPIFVISGTEITPLLFAPVSVEESDGKLVLRAEDDAEPSYAALQKLGLSEDEISQVLEESASVQPQPGQSRVEALEAFLIAKLSETRGESAERVPWNGRGEAPFRPGTLCDVPCLFWVQSDQMTGNLIQELQKLSEPTTWQLVPEALRQLLSRAQESNYPTVPPFSQDDNVYVTEINDPQRQAVAAMAEQKVTVVTGPPGTGKSQLVLNMVAQALLRGESVLFASHNNKAVDVVMDRLSEELKFVGGVRTGKRDFRLKAAADMSTALSRISADKTPPSAGALRQRYRELKAEVIEAEEVLYRVRELSGLFDSYESERNDIAMLLPGKVAEQVLTNAPSFRSDEIEHLQEVLSSLHTNALTLQDKAERIRTEVLAVVRDNRLGSPLFDDLQRFEKQWGTFGGGFLHAHQFNSLEDSRQYIEQWLSLAPAFDLHREITDLSRSYRELSNSYGDGFEQQPPPLQGQVDDVASRLGPDELSLLAEESLQLANQARALAEGRQSMWGRLMTWLHVKNPPREIARKLAELEGRLKPDSSISPEFADLKVLADECSTMAKFTQVSLLKSRLGQTGQTIESKRKSLSEYTSALPTAVRDDIEKVELSSVNSAEILAALQPLTDQVDTLIELRDRLTARVNAKIDDNEDSLKTLADLKQTSASKDKRLWTLRIPGKLEVLIRHLEKWRNITLLLTADAGAKHVQGQLESLPSEAVATDTLNKRHKAQLTTGATIMNAYWIDRSRQLDASTLQHTSLYVSALQQLAAGFVEEGYRELKSAEEYHQPKALSVFPIWATTNLTAKTNLPLTPGLFDTVIIDEASQCDVPSALPMLYRAKRIVVIGDPNQLRHVATLFEKSDQEAARKFGVAPEAFLYNRHSLFDIAERSVGTRPGTLLLREHYRSHPAIIQFSNKEFYDEKLVIKTDMGLRDIPKDLKGIGCGVFWLHVDGVAEHPPRGSAHNMAEIHAVQQLVPELLQVLNRYHMDNATLGIVTPYRQQSNKLEQWVKSAYGQSERIIVGTAHAFQGDQRDIMIFSSVIAPGLSEGSLNWLHRTANLLNVSVSRARNALIVVGHWDHCMTLPLESKYRRLAEYIGDPKRSMVVRQIGELPFINGRPFNIIGTLLNTTDSKDSRRATLRKMLTLCQQFVWWVDPYFQNHVFDVIKDAIQEPGLDIRDIRLLTSQEQFESTDGQKPKISA